MIGRVPPRTAPRLHQRVQREDRRCRIAAGIRDERRVAQLPAIDLDERVHCALEALRPLRVQPVCCLGLGRGPKPPRARQVDHPLAGIHQLGGQFDARLVGRRKEDHVHIGIAQLARVQRHNRDADTSAQPREERLERPWLSLRAPRALRPQQRNELRVRMSEQTLDELSARVAARAHDRDVQCVFQGAVVRSSPFAVRSSVFAIPMPSHPALAAGAPAALPHARIGSR